jgi:hypothetical protein
MKCLYILALATPVAMLSAAAPALACEAAGPNAHVGIVTDVDHARSTLTLKDAGPLTFLARPDLLRGIAPKDEVAVKFAPTGKTLRATSIEKTSAALGDRRSRAGPRREDGQ